MMSVGTRIEGRMSRTSYAWAFESARAAVGPAERRSSLANHAMSSWSSVLCGATMRPIAPSPQWSTISSHWRSRSSAVCAQS